MKIAKKHKIPKKPIIAIFILLVLGGIGGYCFYQSQQPNNSVSTDIRPQNTVDYTAPSSTEQQQKEGTKTEVINKNEQTKDGQSTTSTNSNIVATLSRANQGGSGLPLNIRTIITGASSGSCAITLTRNGQPTINKTFPIVSDATYATCQQADIPAAEFSVGGEWQLSIVATSGNSSSQPITGSVNITK